MKHTNIKRKILLASVFVIMFICIFAVSVSAKALEKYCNVKITFASKETVTAYFEIGK